MPILKFEESLKPGPKFTYFATRSNMYKALEELSNPRWLNEVEKKQVNSKIINAGFTGMARLFIFRTFY
jgi:hypothetical protein